MVALVVGGGLVMTGLLVAAVLVVVHVTGVGGATHRATGRPTTGQPMVAVWLDDGISPARQQKILTTAQTDPGVLSVSYLSPAQYARSGQRLPAALRPDKPTAMLVVRVRDADAVKGVAEELGGLPGVASVRQTA